MTCCAKQALRIGVRCKAQTTVIAWLFAADRPSPQMHATHKVGQRVLRPIGRFCSGTLGVIVTVQVVCLQVVLVMKSPVTRRRVPEQGQAVVAYTISRDGVIRTTAKSVLESAPGKTQLRAVERIRRAKANREEGSAEHACPNPTPPQTGAVG